MGSKGGRNREKDAMRKGGSEGGSNSMSEGYKS